MVEMTTQWHYYSCVATRCCHEGPGSLEEQMVNISLFAWPDCRGTVLHLLIIIPQSHKRNLNVAYIIDYIPAGQQLNTHVHQTLPFVRKWAGS